MTLRKRNPTQYQKEGQTPIVEIVEPDVPLPLQPTAVTTQPTRKRGCKRKATKGDAETEPPFTKAKTRSMVKNMLPNRDALPAPGDHPAIPSTRRTSRQVAVQHNAVWKVPEEEIEGGKAANEASRRDADIDNLTDC